MNVAAALVVGCVRASTVVASCRAGKKDAAALFVPSRYEAPTSFLSRYSSRPALTTSAFLVHTMLDEASIYGPCSALFLVGWVGEAARRQHGRGADLVLEPIFLPINPLLECFPHPHEAGRILNMWTMMMMMSILIRDSFWPPSGASATARLSMGMAGGCLLYTSPSPRDRG